MIGPRSETRTEKGWQRFDRVAGLVSLLLVLALLILWLARTDTGTGGQSDAPAAPLSSLTEPDGKLGTPQADDGSAGTAITAAVVAAGEAGSTNADNGADKLAMVEADASKDAARLAAADKQEDKQPAQKTDKQKKPAGNEPKNAIKKEEKKGAPEKVEIKKPEAKQTSEPKSDNKVDQKVVQTASSDNGAGKSLASQDPAKQATFERIPKYIDKSITAAGDDAGTVAPATTEPNTSAAIDKPVSDIERSATSLVKQVPKVNSVLELSSADGRLSIDGIVSSDQVRASILKAGLQAYGMRNLTDRLSVNTAVAPFDWADNASDLIVLIGGPESETTVRIDGESVTLTGSVNDLGDKQARALAAQQLFGTRARVDNRLKVVPKPAAAKVAANAGQSKPAQGKTTKPEPKKPEPKKSEPAKVAKPAEAARPDPAKGAVSKPADAAGQDPSQLAEGGPGQVDRVVMSSRGMPKKFSRGDCPRVMTGVRIRFRSASTDIPADGRAYLDRLKRCFGQRSYIVRGHTDSRGAALNNLILSQARAQAVVDYLVSIGVPANRVSAKGSGEATPVDSNRTERGRARNRRIDFRFKR